MTDKANIVCMKWGSAYEADYVNTLYSMVKRNITRPFHDLFASQISKKIYVQKLKFSICLLLVLKTFG